MNNPQISIQLKLKKQSCLIGFNVLEAVFRLVSL